MSDVTGWIARRDGKEINCELERLDVSHLDDLDVVVDVHYSGINYKDALALHGRPGVVRRFPLVVGIDATGEVLSSVDDRWRPGDIVTLTGAGLGEELHGGLATRAHLPADPLIAVPGEFTTAQVAAIGTAGFTAALCIDALAEHDVAPGSGEVLVTGASGGVGSVAIAMLARAGYTVVAATGRPDEQAEQLQDLGAASVIHRDELTTSGRPLQSQRWAGVLDTVGGPILAGAIAQTNNDGAVAACGLAASADLPTTVMPFILRGVSLLGINSVQVTRARREAAWTRLARDLDPVILESRVRTVPLAEAKEAAAELLAGRGTGRIVVDARA